MFLEERLDEIKVEYVFQHLDVVLSGVNNFDLERAIRLGADGAEVDIRDIGDLVGGQGFGNTVDLIRDTFWCRCAVCKIVFDAKVLSGSCNAYQPTRTVFRNVELVHLLDYGWR